MAEKECRRCGDCCINPTLELRPPQYSDFRETDGWEDLGNSQGYRVVGKAGPCSHLEILPTKLTSCDIYSRRPTTCSKHFCNET